VRLDQWYAYDNIKILSRLETAASKPDPLHGHNKLHVTVKHKSGAALIWCDIMCDT